MRIDELENLTTIYSPVDKYDYVKFFQTYNDEYVLCGIWFRSPWSAPNVNGEKVRERKYGYDFLPESIFYDRLITNEKLVNLKEFLGDRLGEVTLSFPYRKKKQSFIWTRSLSFFPLCHILNCKKEDFKQYSNCYIDEFGIRRDLYSNKAICPSKNYCGYVYFLVKRDTEIAIKETTWGTSIYTLVKKSIKFNNNIIDFLIK